MLPALEMRSRRPRSGFPFPARPGPVLLVLVRPNRAVHHPLLTNFHIRGVHLLLPQALRLRRRADRLTSSPIRERQASLPMRRQRVTRLAMCRIRLGLIRVRLGLVGTRRHPNRIPRATAAVQAAAVRAAVVRTPMRHRHPAAIATLQGFPMMGAPQRVQTGVGDRCPKSRRSRRTNGLPKT